MASKKKRKSVAKSGSSNKTKSGPSNKTKSGSSNKTKSQITNQASKKPKLQNNKLLLYVLGGIVILGGAWLIMGGGGEENYDDLNLPSYAYTNAVTLKAYAYTIKNPEVIEKIPCYCGCEIKGHKSLKNCYMFDDGAYTSHASNCDICVGEVIRIKKLYESGLYISEIKEIIDQEYSKYGPGNGGVPITQDFNINLKDVVSAPRPTPVKTIDYSNLELSSNFLGLSDGLNMTPRGVIWAQFVNMKQLAGTPLEAYASNRVQPPGFYGVPLVAMYSADYDQNSWIELHDIGYTNLGIKAVNEPGMSNVVVTRPFIFGHTNNVQLTQQLMDDPTSMENAYGDYQSVLDKAGDESAGIAMVARNPNTYADVYYSQLNEAGSGLVQRVLIYNLLPGGESLTAQYEARAVNSLANGFTRYDVNQDGNTLTVTLVGTLDNVLNEAL